MRSDVPLPILVDFLRLAFDGLVSGLAAGMPTDHLPGVLDLVEDAVRTRTSTLLNVRATDQQTGAGT